ncbi:antirestriction protein [Kiloniella sp.]|uniref:antirestriction protein n=1 Tax=Kiloniella sp. TaxID=1938587 RepID=UPI003B011846
MLDSLERPVLNAASLVPDELRPQILPKYFGRHMMLVETSIYGFLSKIAPEYKGGYWDLYEIPSGFFMAPSREERLRLQITSNYFDAEVSGEAAGVIACLFVYCEMAWREPTSGFSDLYHSLRDFASLHPEASQIYSAID